MAKKKSHEIGPITAFDVLVGEPKKTQPTVFEYVMAALARGTVVDITETRVRLTPKTNKKPKKRGKKKKKAAKKAAKPKKK